MRSLHEVLNISAWMLLLECLELLSELLLILAHLALDLAYCFVIQGFNRRAVGYRISNGWRNTP